MIGLRPTTRSIIFDRVLASAPSAWATQPASAIIGLLPSSRRSSADVGIGLFRRLLADMAGVEHDQVGILALGDSGHALRPSSSAMRSPS